MTGKHIITDGCEFQSDCIEYKDISYLKIMPICAIHELSIACHDKVNKCKYYTLYRQLKDRLKYKQALDEIEDIADDYNRVEKTSQYYRDGFDEIQNIINEIKGIQ